MCLCVCICVCVSVWKRVSVSVCMCVCVCVRERERVSVCWDHTCVRLAKDKSLCFFGRNGKRADVECVSNYNSVLWLSSHKQFWVKQYCVIAAKRYCDKKIKRNFSFNIFLLSELTIFLWGIFLCKCLCFEMILIRNKNILTKNIFFCNTLLLKYCVVKMLFVTRALITLLHVLILNLIKNL